MFFSTSLPTDRIIVSGKGLVKTFGSGLLKLGCDVAVSVNRDLDGTVPQPLLHDFRMYTETNQ